MKLLLDTNVLSEIERQRDDTVRQRISAFRSGDLFVSVITLGEIGKGVALMPLGRRREHLAQWLIATRRTFGERILAVDLEIAEQWGALDAAAIRRGTPVSVADGLIAATARIHGLHVATRNVRHMISAGAVVYDPWAGSTHEPSP